MNARQAIVFVFCVAIAAFAFCACGGSATVRAQRAHPAQATRAKPLRVFEGLASFYSDALAGHKTSNGERYDPAARTAASRDLPFDSVVRVTRIETGAQVIVRVNDRGPFGDRRRVLDLSRAAARDLGILGAGVARVRVEVLQLGKHKSGATRKSSRRR